MNLCEKKLCTGCAACANACPKNAITFMPDDEGFLRPVIRHDLCINCDSCSRACPQIKESVQFRPDKSVFACWHKDKRIRRDSTSGGAFSALAESVIKHGGVVYGAVFDCFPLVRHAAVETMEGLVKFRNSKYVQSEIGYVFRDVKDQLAQGRRVLFSGTACQIDGLCTYLGDTDRRNLVTVDLVCHGVPSPLLFSEYIHYLENKYQSPITSYNFRVKKPGWNLHSTEIRFKNHRPIVSNFFENAFFRGFLRNYFLRPCCHVCRHANSNRPGDITLSDFWGYKPMRSDGRDNDKDRGVSMVMLNSSAGCKLFEESKGSLAVWPRKVEDATYGNPALNAPYPEPPDRRQFWIDHGRISFEELLLKYCYPEELTGWWLTQYTLNGRLHERLRRAKQKAKSFLIHTLGQDFCVGMKKRVCFWRRRDRKGM